MSIENPFSNQLPPEEGLLTREKKETSSRLLLAIETNLIPLVGKVEVIGRENLTEMPPNKKVIILTSHLSDIDIPLTIKALGHDFDIAVVDQSTHHSFREDPAGKISIGLAGEKNFIPIDWKVVDGEKQSRFNADNFASMSEALDSGKDLVFAAHNPSENGELTNGGVGGVYLSQLSDAIILPVAINIKGEGFLAGKNVSKSVINRPDAEVSIGSPIKLEKIEGIERYKEILDKRKNKQKLTPEEISEFKELTQKLRDQSDIVMNSIAQMLPENKRGVYVFKEETSS